MYATDIADVIVNVLALCPETQKDKIYPSLLGNVYPRADSDKRCRCALYQEMVELFTFFYKDLNVESHGYGSKPITVDCYSRVVKLSVLGVEFRDKLFVQYRIGDNYSPTSKKSGSGPERPMLLGHAAQPIAGHQHVKMKPQQVYKEIYDYI